MHATRLCADMVVLVLIVMVLFTLLDLTVMVLLH